MDFICLSVSDLFSLISMITAHTKTDVIMESRNYSLNISS